VAACIRRTIHESRIYFDFLVVHLLALASAQIGMYQHGSVIRMHMADCGVTRHSFITNFGSPATPNVEEYCPEYTLLSDNVVYLIVGKIVQPTHSPRSIYRLSFTKERAGGARRRCQARI